MEGDVSSFGHLLELMRRDDADNSGTACLEPPGCCDGLCVLVSFGGCLDECGSRAERGR